MATSNGILFDIKNLKNRRCGAFPHFQKKKKIAAEPESML
jgi:hypothetical protein